MTSWAVGSLPWSGAFVSSRLSASIHLVGVYAEYERGVGVRAWRWGEDVTVYFDGEPWRRWVAAWSAEGRYALRWVAGGAEAWHQLLIDRYGEDAVECGAATAARIWPADADDAAADAEWAAGTSLDGEDLRNLREEL